MPRLCVALKNLETLVQTVSCPESKLKLICVGSLCKYIRQICADGLSLSDPINYFPFYMMAVHLAGEQSSIDQQLPLVMNYFLKVPKNGSTVSSPF